MLLAMAFRYALRFTQNLPMLLSQASSKPLCLHRSTRQRPEVSLPFTLQKTGIPKSTPGFHRHPPCVYAPAPVASDGLQRILREASRHLIPAVPSLRGGRQSSCCGGHTDL